MSERRRIRSNGEGSVRESKTHGRWEGRLTVGWTADGRQIRKMFTGPTKKAVVARMDEARRALENGMAVPDNNVTVSEFLTW